MQKEQVKMAGNKDLKLKRSFEDDYGSTPKEAFKKAKTETQSHYMAFLTMQKEQTDAILSSMMPSLK